MHMLEFQTDDDAGNGKNRWVVHTSPITSMRGLLVITYRVLRLLIRDGQKVYIKCSSQLRDEIVSTVLYPRYVYFLPTF